jgi:hypothetical protein
MEYIDLQSKNLKSKNLILSNLKEQIRPIFIYKVSRLSNEVSFDTYDSFICAATSVDNARNIHPSGKKENFNNKYFSGWIKQDKKNTLTVTKIGIADLEIEEDTVIISSFNAG